MIPSVIWVACARVGGSSVGRIAIQAIVRVLPVLSRRTVASYFKTQLQQTQAVLVLRQMARLFRMNSTRPVGSVAAEAVKPFVQITNAVGEGPAAQFFAEMWEILCKDIKLLEFVLRG